jgi:hypothetical protein
MSRGKMIGMSLGTVLAVALWVSSQAFALDEKPPLSDSPAVRGPQPDESELLEGRRRSGRRGFGKRHRRPTYERLPEELRDQVDDFIEQYFPEQFQKLYGLDEESQDAFDRRVNRMLPRMMRLMRLEQDDPDTFHLRVQELRISMKIRALARRIADGRGDDGAEELKVKLRKHLEKRFDLRHKIHRIEVQRLERRLATARDRLDRRKAEKEEIIDEELQEILTSPPGEHRGHRARERRRPPEVP